MNDQDAGLVDTKLALAHHFETREVSGGCFCCHFSDLMDAAEQLLSYEPDVILAEPVGSCIDLSATILQPLKAFHHQEYRLAPLTVLVDPSTADQADAVNFQLKLSICSGSNSRRLTWFASQSGSVSRGARSAVPD